jgi:hypothetical protein
MICAAFEFYYLELVGPIEAFISVLRNAVRTFQACNWSRYLSSAWFYSCQCLPCSRLRVSSGPVMCLSCNSSQFFLRDQQIAADRGKYCIELAFFC